MAGRPRRARLGGDSIMFRIKYPITQQPYNTHTQSCNNTVSTYTVRQQPCMVNHLDVQLYNIQTKSNTNHTVSRHTIIPNPTFLLILDQLIICEWYLPNISSRHEVWTNRNIIHHIFSSAAQKIKAHHMAPWSECYHTTELQQTKSYFNQSVAAHKIILHRKPL